MGKFYPLTFRPIFREKIWGGQKIKTILGKDTGQLPNCGETWELSGVQGSVSKVATGYWEGEEITTLIAQYGEQLVGRKVYQKFGNEFPLLIKFIDAKQDLSIQVHPNDDLAKQRYHGNGKTEMWYVLQADKDATLISGFNREITKQEYLKYFNDGRLMELLNVEPVKKGDAFHIPAGRVHTIGKGILLAEIQQTSDITYRIYDFDRVDKNGNKRALHVEKALGAIDFKHYQRYRNAYGNDSNRSNNIVTTSFFTTNKLYINQKTNIDRSALDCFKIYIGVSGGGKVAGTSIRLGEVLLIPAAMKRYSIEPDGEEGLELLETYIE